MPEGKQFIKDFILSHGPIKRILDVGPGSGNYHDLLTKYGEYSDYPGGTLNDVEWVGVEIWEPYLNHFSLGSKYDKIIVLDIFDFDWPDRYDIAILGDVLEHMPAIRGAAVVKQAVEHANWVIISLPIVDCPQEASYGNPYEAHIEQYNPSNLDSILKEFTVIDSYLGETIGVFILKGVSYS
jgi:SAM-dependent methyltransferase